MCYFKEEDCKLIIIVFKTYEMNKKKYCYTVHYWHRTLYKYNFNTCLLISVFSHIARFRPHKNYEGKLHTCNLFAILLSWTNSKQSQVYEGICWRLQLIIPLHCIGTLVLHQITNVTVSGSESCWKSVSPSRLCMTVVLSSCNAMCVFTNKHKLHFYYICTILTSIECVWLHFNSSYAHSIISFFMFCSSVKITWTNMIVAVSVLI